MTPSAVAADIASGRISLDGLIAAYRMFGIEERQIVVLPGAETRFARMFTEGWNRGVQGTVAHHTAERFGTRAIDSVNYMTFGKGDGFVTSNTYVDNPAVASNPDYARIWILAIAGGTYTEGKGGARGLIAKDGANRVVFSDEIANDGTGVHEYPPAQIDLVVRKHAAEGWYFSKVYRWADDPYGSDRLFSHAEWRNEDGSKSDPAGECIFQDGTGRAFYQTRVWNEDLLRTAVRDLAWSVFVKVTTPEPPKPTPSEEDDMLEFIILWQDTRYANQFAVNLATGGAHHLSPKTMALITAKMEAAGLSTKVVEVQHDQELASVLAKCGLTTDDLVSVSTP